MDITKMSEVELKALGFDIKKRLEVETYNLQLINAQLERLEKLKTEVVQEAKTE